MCSVVKAPPSVRRNTEPHVLLGPGMPVPRFEPSRRWGQHQMSGPGLLDVPSPPEDRAKEQVVGVDTAADHSSLTSFRRDVLGLAEQPVDENTSLGEGKPRPSENPGSAINETSRNATGGHGRGYVVSRHNSGEQIVDSDLRRRISGVDSMRGQAAQQCSPIPDNAIALIPFAEHLVAP